MYELAGGCIHNYFNYTDSSNIRRIVEYARQSSRMWAHLSRHLSSTWYVVCLLAGGFCIHWKMLSTVNSYMLPELTERIRTRVMYHVQGENHPILVESNESLLRRHTQQASDSTKIRWFFPWSSYITSVRLVVNRTVCIEPRRHEYDVIVMKVTASTGKTRK